MPKLPAFQFYPGDWLNDIKLQSCNMAAQGLLINLMCLMHQSERYGYLLINGSKPDENVLMKLLRTHQRTFKTSIHSLLHAGVLHVDEEGVIYCKRMVRDEALRETRRRIGKLGGNPNLVNQRVNQASNQKPTPSSSSSSSSSSSGKDKKIDTPIGVSSSGVAEAGLRNKAVPDCPHKEIIAAYHETLPNLPAVKIWNAEQQKLMRARWKEDPERQSVDWWRSFFEYVATSDFLMGRKTDFCADLEWLVRPRNFAKIANGRYHQEHAWEGKVSAKTARSIVNMQAWAERKRLELERSEGVHEAPDGAV